MKKKYIVGHKNPDTDTIVSAIVCAGIKNKQHGDGHLAARPGDINKETSYVLERFGLDLPAVIPSEEKAVILVDHNEPAQIHENIKHEEIVGIYDHHKLGGLITSAPIDGIFETVGATATLIAKLAFGSGLQLSANESGALIAAIVSDTFNLTSPTTTATDKEMLEKLNATAGLNVAELANKMFEAKSDISDISTEKLATSDMKVFAMNGKSVGVGVWETVRPEQVMARKDEILDELRRIKEKEGLCGAFFFVIDILNESSQLLILSEVEKDCAKESFGYLPEEGIVALPGIVSRKKQIVPLMEEYFEKVNV